MCKTLTMAADGLPHRASWICWPTRVEPWGSEAGRARARRSYSDIARVIAAFEPVKCAVCPEDAAGAREILGPEVEIFAVPIDDGWARDSGPTFLSGPEGSETRQWQYKGHGYAPFAKDAMLAHRIAAHLSLPCEMAEISCDGSLICTDGEGTLMAAEAPLCSAGYNGPLSREEIATRLRQATGTEKLFWLPPGVTARFAGAGKILLSVPPYDDDPVHEAINTARARLRGATDAAGRTQEIIEVEEPRHPQYDRAGSPLPASYVKFAYLNGALLLPVFDENNDEKAAATFHRLYPDRKIVRMDVHTVLAGGGDLHRMILPEPAP